MISIVVPAFNEETKIQGVIKDLQSHGYHNIIVIDDCSTDHTKAKAAEMDVTVLHHVINRGQGASLRTGIDYALKHGASYIVHFDSDGQHHAEDIKELLKPVQEKKVDVALGSRFIKKTSNTPFMRKMFLKGGTLVCRMLYGLKLTDTHNGLRAFSRYAAKKVTIESDRMEHASEILELIAKHKLRYIEIPVLVTYSEYSQQHGQSTWNAFRILYKMIIKKFMD